jgi:putative membrane protein
MMWEWGYGGEVAWWMVVLDVIVPLLVIAAIVALAMFLFRQAERTPSHVTPGDAQHVLDERFARGEIDEDEFKRRSATLRSHAGHA